MTFLTIANILLLIINLLLGCVAYREKHYKTSSLNFFVAGCLFITILNAII